MNNKFRSITVAMLASLFFCLAFVSLGTSVAHGTEAKIEKASANSTVKWIKSSSKSFEYSKDFIQVRYKQKIYNIPKQMSRMPVNIQNSIRKEYVRVKTLELKDRAVLLAEPLVNEQVQPMLIKLVEKEVTDQVRSEIERIENESLDKVVKSYVSSNTEFIKESAIEEGMCKANEMLQDPLDEFKYNISGTVARNAVAIYAKKTSLSTMRISSEALAETVKEIVPQAIKTIDTRELEKTIADSLNGLAKTVVTDIINKLIALDNTPYKKPVIYLYPQQRQAVKVVIDDRVKLDCTYPNYEQGGWKVIAHPDGRIVDEKTGREYYCLYWEGRSEYQFDLTTGFVVKGEETSIFLEDKLKRLGLTDKEANEFIIYWLPLMEKNKYNLIHFATKQYDQQVPLKISPQPDTLLRVLMVYKPLEEAIQIKEQRLETTDRKGFVVVEWGGMEVK